MRQAQTVRPLRSNRETCLTTFLTVENRSWHHGRRSKKHPAT